MATPSSDLSRLSIQLYKPTPLSPNALHPSERSKRGRSEAEKEQEDNFLDARIMARSADILKKKKMGESIFFNKFKSHLLNSSDLDPAMLFLRFSQEPPEKILRDAATSGATSVVKAFIATGMNLDGRDESDKTAVLLAVSRGHFHIAKLLIDAGAKDERGQSLLIRAIQKKEHALIPAFVLDREMLDDADFTGQSPLIHAVLLEDMKTLEILLAAKPNLELKDSDQLTAMHRAIRQGNAKIVAKLIENKANVEALTLFEMTPLMLAAGLNNSAIVQELLVAGAKIAPISTRRVSALSLAIKNDHKENVALILEAIGALRTGGFGLSLSSHVPPHSTEEELSQDPSLLLALCSGRLESALELAKKKIGIFYQDNGEIPLIWAAKENCFEVVEILVDAGVEVEDRDRRKCSAYSYAHQLGYKKIADFLFQAGARNFKGETLMTEAIVKRDFRALESSLKEFLGKNLIEKQNSNGETPLTLAIENEEEEMVRLLIASGVNLESRNSKEYTPLLKAFKYEVAISLIMMLIEAGANVRTGFCDYLETENVLLMHSAFDTPLQFAVERKNPLILKALILKGADVDERDREGRTPFLQAVMGFKRTCEKELILQKKILRCLLDCGADINAQRHKGGSALIFAVKNGHISLVEFLIAAGASLDLKAANGNSALKIAKKLKLDVIADLLWKAGAKDTKGNTYLIDRVYDKDVPSIKKLIAEKANLNSQNNLGQSALSIALERGFREIMSLFLEGGANPNLQDNLGYSLFLQAAWSGQADFLPFLIEHKANLQIRSYDGSTALHLAATNGNNCTLKMLISLGVNLDAQRNDRMTALQVAKQVGQESVVQTLMEAGARDEFGQTPLMRAVRSGDMKGVRELIVKGVDLDASIDRRPDENALSYSVASKNVEGFIALVEAGAKFYSYEERLLRALIVNLSQEGEQANEKYRTLIDFFFTPFAEHFVELAGSPKLLLDHLNMRSEKFFLDLLEKIPSEQHHHLLKLTLLLPSFEGCVSSKLSSETLQRGFEALRKEFPSFSQFLYHSLKESHLRVSQEHFKHAIDESIPDAPEVDLTLFLKLFKKINFENPQLPGYAHPRMLKNDAGVLVEIEFFKENLTTYVRRIKNQEPFLGTPRAQDVQELSDYYTRLTNLARHLLLKLQEPMDPDNKTSLLIDLANAGSHCGARYMSESYAWYQRVVVKALPEALTVSEKIFSTLTNFRLSILSKLVLNELQSDGELVALGNLPHVRNQYLQMIGKEFALPGYAVVHADPGFTLGHLLKPVVRLKFLNLYHPSEIISYIQEVILDPSPLSLNYQEVVYWFEAHVPEDWKKVFYESLTLKIGEEIEREEKVFSVLSAEERLILANERIKTKIFPKYQFTVLDDPRDFERIEKLIDARIDLKGNQRENMKKQMRQEIVAFENPQHLFNLRIQDILNKYEISSENPKKWREGVAQCRIQEYMREQVYAGSETLGFKRSAIERMLIILKVLEVIT